MKRLWSDEDLVVHFTLLPQELDLLQNKAGATRLGFSVLLKCFQYEGRFPARHEVPPVVVQHVAAQVGVPAAQFQEYPAGGRTVEYHRAQIREALGFRAITDADIEAILAWMNEHILPQERDLEALATAFCSRCRELCIEPPTTKRLDRLVHSALESTKNPGGLRPLPAVCSVFPPQAGNLDATDGTAPPNPH